MSAEIIPFPKTPAPNPTNTTQSSEAPKPQNLDLETALRIIEAVKAAKAPRESIFDYNKAYIARQLQPVSDVTATITLGKYGCNTGISAPPPRFRRNAAGSARSRERPWKGADGRHTVEPDRQTVRHRVWLPLSGIRRDGLDDRQ